MENVLMGNTGAEKFGPAPEETKPPVDSSPAQPVNVPPFPGGGGGGIDAEQNKKAPTQPGEDTPTDTPTDSSTTETPSAPNYLIIAGGLALLYFLFKRKRK